MTSSFFTMINHAVVNMLAHFCANRLGFLQNNFPHTCQVISATLESLLNVCITRYVPGRSEFWTQESFSQQCLSHFC